MSGTKEDIKQVIDKMVDEHLEKAMPSDLEENGGGDKIRSGSPFTEKGSGSKGGGESGAEAAGSQKKGDPMSQSEPSEKTGEDHKKKMKKSEDETSEEDEVAKAKESAKEEAKEKHEEGESKAEEKKEEKAKMKKAMEELGELDDEEIELVKAWREEKAAEEEEVSKSLNATPAFDPEVLSKAISDAVAPLQGKIAEDKEIIKSLTEKVEKLASQPAYDKRSLSGLEPIEKGGDSETEISKSQVLDKMLDLQREGKGVRSNHITEFEATQNISDPSIRKLVMDQFK